MGHLKNTRYINVPIYNVSMEDDILNLDTSIGITLVFPNIRDSGCMYADKRWYVNDASGTASANPVTIISVSGIQINDGVSQQLSTDNFGTSIFATNENKYIITGTGSGGGSTIVTSPFTPLNTPIIVGDDFQEVAEKSQGQINDIVTNVTTLQNNEYKITYFAEISAATGTITKPTGSAILLDQFAGGVDAYVSTIANGQPTGNFPTTAGGVAVDVSSFNTLGNFTLSGTPSGYPVALIYILKIKAQDYSNLDITKILDLEGVSVVNLIRQEFLYTSGAQTFTLSNSASAVYAVFVNGQELRQSQYTVVTTTLTIVDTLEASDRVDVIYSNATLGINPSYTKAETDTLLNAKVSSNTAITGATKTKITYDAKGLVTSGADANTADIADSSNKRYVTDAQLVVIGNTSGTNTGDVSVTDGSTIDFTLTGQALTAEVKDNSITEAKQLLADNTTNDVSTAKHGYAPKLPNDATMYLNGTGTYSVPAGGGGGTSATSNLFAYYNFI